MHFATLLAACYCVLGFSAVAATFTAQHYVAYDALGETSRALTGVVPPDVLLRGANETSLHYPNSTIFGLTVPATTQQVVLYGRFLYVCSASGVARYDAVTPHALERSYTTEPCLGLGVEGGYIFRVRAATDQVVRTLESGSAASQQVVASVAGAEHVAVVGDTVFYVLPGNLRQIKCLRLQEQGTVACTASEEITLSFAVLALVPVPTISCICAHGSAAVMPIVCYFVPVV